MTRDGRTAAFGATAWGGQAIFGMNHGTGACGRCARSVGLAIDTLLAVDRCYRHAIAGEPRAKAAGSASGCPPTIAGNGQARVANEGARAQPCTGRRGRTPTVAGGNTLAFCGLAQAKGQAVFALGAVAVGRGTAPRERWVAWQANLAGTLAKATTHEGRGAVAVAPNAALAGGVDGAAPPNGARVATARGGLPADLAMAGNSLAAPFFLAHAGARTIVVGCGRARRRYCSAKPLLRAYFGKKTVAILAHHTVVPDRRADAALGTRGRAATHVGIGALASNAVQIAAAIDAALASIADFATRKASRQQPGERPEAGGGAQNLLVNHRISSARSGT